MPGTFDRELLRGSLDLMVLSVLAESPAYGYLIQKRISDTSAGRVNLQAGTLYPLLHRLEADGALSTRMDRSTGRDRKLYELTAAGRRRMHRQAVEWHEYAQCMRDLVRPILAALPNPPEAPEVSPA